MYPAPLPRSLNQRFRISLSNFFGAVSNCSGILAGVIPCDLSVTLTSAFGSVTMFPEWSSWAALFSQVRCVQLEIRCIPIYVDEVKGDSNNGLLLAGNLQSTTVPSTYQTLSDNADVQSWNPITDTGGQGRYHAISHSKLLGFTASSTPVPSANNYMGCPGGIAFYGSGYTAGINVTNIIVTGHYELMNRT
jgi:hypothetical protein